MVLIADTGAVLRRLDCSKTSQVTMLFMPGHGKVRAIAKCNKCLTKARFAVGIDLLETGDMVFTMCQARPAVLTEWK